MTPCLALALALTAAPIPENWVGTLQQHPIHLRLIQTGGALQGSYRYDKIGLSIPLAGTMDEKGHVTLHESNAKGAPTGDFDGMLSALEFHGTWTAPKSRKPLSFELKRDDKPTFSTNWTGMLGKKLRIEVHLDRNGDGLKGSYFYENHGKDIALEGHIDASDAVTLTETDQGQVTGSWQLKLEVNGGLKGTWSDPKGKKSFPVLLRETKELLARGDLVSSGAVQVYSVTVEDSSPASGSSGNECTRTYTYPTFKGAPNAQAERALAALALPRPQKLTQEDCDSCEEESHGFEVALNQGTLFSATISDESYCGGAHPNHGSIGATIDLRTGKRLALADLFKPNSYPALTQRATKQLLADEKAASLDDTGIAEPVINVDTAWYLTPEALVFHWNPYALDCYARGDIEIALPYASLRDLALPDGPLAPLLKGN